MIDQTKKVALIEQIKQRQLAGESEILLDPSLYFDGYEHNHCTICANNSVSVSTTQFAERLRTIAKRSDVAAIFVRLCEYDDAIEFDDCWIGSDTIYVVTSADEPTVEQWFVDFEVTEVHAVQDIEDYSLPCEIPVGYRLIAAWWD